MKNIIWIKTLSYLSDQSVFYSLNQNKLKNVTYGVRVISSTRFFYISPLFADWFWDHPIPGYIHCLLW